MSENLLQFVSRIEKGLLDLGFEFGHQSPNSGSRYYFKPVNRYYWLTPDGHFEKIGKVLKVRVSDHHLPLNQDGSLRGDHDYEFIHGEDDDDIQEKFKNIACYKLDFYDPQKIFPHHKFRGVISCYKVES